MARKSASASTVWSSASAPNRAHKDRRKPAKSAPGPDSDQQPVLPRQFRFRADGRARVGNTRHGPNGRATLPRRRAGMLPAGDAHDDERPAAASLPADRRSEQFGRSRA